MGENISFQTGHNNNTMVSQLLVSLLESNLGILDYEQLFLQKKVTTWSNIYIVYTEQILYWFLVGKVLVRCGVQILCSKTETFICILFIFCRWKWCSVL